MIALALAIVGPVAGASAAPPIWESEYGAPIAGITEGDDEATEIPLGSFSFPFYGTTYTGADTFGVSSNGLIELDAKSENNIPESEFARTGPPKIAALWADLYLVSLPPDQGTAWMNTFNEDGDPAIDRVVFTWDGAFFGCVNRPSCRALVQVQLFDSGRIVFGYNGVLTNQALDNYGEPGLMPLVTKGGFVPPPEANFVQPPPGIDYSESVPFEGGDLIFEQFSGTPVHFDLDQSNLVFDPTGADSYRVTSPVDIGVTATGKKASIAAGETVTYTAKVGNDGSQTAANVSLLDTLPKGAAVTSVKAGQGSCTGKGPVSCSLGTLAAGATATVTIKAKLSEVGAAVNRIDVATTTPGDGRGNNTAEVATNVGKDNVAPKVKLKIHRSSLHKLLAKGLKVRVKCSEACFAQLKLGSKSPKLKKAGGATAEMGRAARRTVTVKLNRAAHRALAGAHGAVLELKAVVVDEAGNRRTVKKTVRAK